MRESLHPLQTLGGRVKLASKQTQLIGRQNALRNMPLRCGSN